ncbi:LLM class flavin-dependent oxidoreductase [Nonomuraea indica]|uniref:LLM class flavin-dependent oxidoreductase n=1 Tax=Nonomuraea indica TaxID=1581193 RepID=UPI000C7BB829|nr:LLM class flavin-dependent oxidoreductase [Nonomuraea indica]
MATRVGVIILPAQRWADSAATWRLAEQMGFAHAWTFDHVTWRDLRDKPWFSAVPTLAAAAAVTTRLRLGTLVCTPNFRHPVVLAKEAMTLDDISCGRFTLGLGAGAAGPDAQVLQQRPALDRGARFAEFAELVDLLLRQRHTTYQGRFYHAHDVFMEPGCRRKPRLPLAVAATGARGIGLAARLADVWVTNGLARPGQAPVVTPRIVAEQAARVRAACAELGRDPDTLARMVVVANRDRSPLASAGAFAEALHRYGEAGMTDLVVPFPRLEPPFAASLAVLERVAEDILPRLPGAAT